MSDRQDGGSAFPVPDVTWPEENVHGIQGVPGMSLRDYFAAAALMGLIACPKQPLDCPVAVQKCHATDAYAFADAMIEARDA